MSSQSWLISRRTLLRGAGSIGIGLPFLNAMLAPGRAAAQTAQQKRFAVYFKPGGVVMNDWKPTQTATGFNLNVTNAPLEPFKNKLLMLAGIDLKIVEIGYGHQHSKGMGGLLTGRELPFGPYETCGGTAGFPGGPSIDQVIAEKLWRGSKFKSLEVAVNWPTDRRDGGKAAPTNCINYSGPNQAVPMATDPKAVWDKLFGSFGATAEQLADTRAKAKSVLDGTSKSYRRLAARVGADDRARLEQHLTKIREVEISLTTVTTSGGACVAPPAPEPLGDPDNGLIGLPGATDQKNPQLDARMPVLGKAMMDLLVMAFVCDLTRVGTMQWVDSQAYNTFPFLQLLDGHHDLQHDSGLRAGALTKIDTWYMSQFAYFLQALTDAKENGVSILDSMGVLLCSDLQQSESHDQTNMPFVVAGSIGGKLRTGRALSYESVPHNNLLVSLLNAYEIDVATFGNPAYCTGPLTGLT